MPSCLCAPLRTLLLAVIAPLLLLAGCTPAEPVFKSTDITGTSYGKTLRLTDHNGQRAHARRLQGQGGDDLLRLHAMPRRLPPPRCRA
jgi:protein SCO1/2